VENWKFFTSVGTGTHDHTHDRRSTYQLKNTGWMETATGYDIVDVPTVLLIWWREYNRSSHARGKSSKFPCFSEFFSKFMRKIKWGFEKKSEKHGNSLEFPLP